MSGLREGPWLSALVFGILFLVIFRRPLLWAGKLLVRSAAALGLLALGAHSGLLTEMALGVNLFNAFILGLLGLPGFGLLLMIQWLIT